MSLSRYGIAFLITAFIFSPQVAHADIVNGDFSSSTLTDGTVNYEDIDAGWFSKNAGSNWVIQSGTLVQASNSGSATRAGQVFDASDLNGTGWFFNFDLSNNSLTNLDIYGGVDDGNNTAGTSVLGFGGDGAPNSAIVQGGSWTPLVTQVGVNPGVNSYSITEDLSGFDLIAVRFRGNGGTVGATLDNLEFSMSAPPPPPPPAQGLINGDFSDPTLIRSGGANYGDLGEGWVGKNAFDGVNTPVNWEVANGELVQQSNSGSATRIGQVFRADNIEGEDVTLSFDLANEGLSRLQVWAGADDGNNLLTDSVFSTGNDNAPNDAIVQGAWTLLLDEQNLDPGSYEFDINANLSDFDLVALRYRGNGGSVGAVLDNVTFAAAVVPEPAALSVWMMGMVCVGAGMRRFRRR